MCISYSSKYLISKNLNLGQTWTVSLQINFFTNSLQKTPSTSDVVDGNAISTKGVSRSCGSGDPRICTTAWFSKKRKWGSLQSQMTSSTTSLDVMGWAWPNLAPPLCNMQTETRPKQVERSDRFRSEGSETPIYSGFSISMRETPLRATMERKKTDAFTFQNTSLATGKIMQIRYLSREKPCLDFQKACSSCKVLAPYNTAVAYIDRKCNQKYV